MNIRRLLAVRGIHYLATRFGPAGLRSAAFDAKYRRGDWDFAGDGPPEFPAIIRRYLRGGDLLVMGCGGASILRSLDNCDYASVLGIDISDEALRLARRLESNKVSFRKEDMENFICPQDYDAILFSESLNYVPAARQRAFLTRLAANLKSGGVFIVTFAQSQRYHEMIENIRRDFSVFEDKTFTPSTRHLLVFSASNPPGPGTS